MARTFERLSDLKRTSLATKPSERLPDSKERCRRLGIRWEHLRAWLNAFLRLP